MTVNTYDANLFYGRRVLVVGGTSGIGAAIAAAFLRWTRQGTGDRRKRR